MTNWNIQKNPDATYRARHPGLFSALAPAEIANKRGTGFVNMQYHNDHYSSTRGNDKKNDAPATGAFEQDTSFLWWWYRLTAPNLVTTDDNLHLRDLSRRGRLTSATLLIVILLVLAAEPVAILGPNKALIFILLLPVAIDIVALIFNKLGRITVAGVLVIVGIEVGLVLSILGPTMAGGGLTSYLLPQFDLMVQAEFVAITLLRPRSVFLMAFLHCTFIIGAILVLPHSAEFAPIFATNEYEIFLRPITLQIIVAFVTYLWVTSAYQATRRADRAEVIAELERREVERQQQEIALKQQLDEGIQQILQTHVQVSNGNFSARAPLKQENVLWRIAYSLNNLLARLQSLHHAEQELQRARSETARLVEMVHRARLGQPTRFERTGTHLDPLILELAGSSFVSDQFSGPMVSPSSSPLGRHAPPAERPGSRNLSF